MRKTREILRLRWGERRTLREVAQSCGVGATTVHDVLARAKAAGLTWPLPDELDEAALAGRLYPVPTGRRDRPLPDFAAIYRELKRRGVTLELLWQAYREEHPERGYGYSCFCALYRRWRVQLDVVMRQERRAGEKLFVDWAGMGIEIVDAATGAVTVAPVFVTALGVSSFTYAEVCESQDMRAWIAAHIHTFEFLGGVAAVTVPDNTKTAVTRPDFYDPELNPTYRELGEHYGMTIIPARVRRPRDKACVENAVLQVERWVLAPLRNQTFFSVAEANQAVRERLAWLNDRPLSRLDGSRRSLFEELDRPALTPLPARRFEIPEWKVDVGVNIDYHVDFDHHFYSVSYQRVGERVDVRATALVVEIFHQDRRVASHRRSYRRGCFTTDRTHMPDSHRRYAEWSPSRLIRWAAQIGPETAATVRAVLAGRPHPEQGFRSCLGIIRLANRYDRDRLERACRRARTLGAPRYRSVQSILKHGLDAQPLPEPLPAQLPLAHENIRGPAYYQPQDGKEDDRSDDNRRDLPEAQ
jgi:transposase